MLTLITILLVLNTLLNLMIGFLLIVLFGELNAVEKFRFEFAPPSSDETKNCGNAAISTDNF